jgi:hypothetical protein
VDRMWPPEFRVDDHGALVTTIAVAVKALP